MASGSACTERTGTSRSCLGIDLLQGRSEYVIEITVESTKPAKSGSWEDAPSRSVRETGLLACGRKDLAPERSGPPREPDDPVSRARSLGSRAGWLLPDRHQPALVTPLVQAGDTLDTPQAGDQQGGDRLGFRGGPPPPSSPRS